MKRLIKSIGLLLLIGAIFLTGCQNTKEQKIASADKVENKLQIGMSFDSFIIERWQRDRDIFVSAAKELGAEVNVQNANGDVNAQIDQIDYFIKKGMDVIVIVCIDSDALSNSVKKAKDAGIKVIAYDRLINNADIDLYITFDNEMVGSLMGMSLIQSGIENGKVIEIGGSLTDNNVSMVENGFNKVMADNNIEVLDTTHCDGWKAEIAGEYVYENLGLVEQADAIMCGNDDIATEVVRTLSENRIAGNVLVTGQDADLSACQRIVEGTQLMTVYKPVEKLATRAAQCAVAMAKGENLEGDDVTTMQSGNYSFPYLGLEPVCVTKENMDEVIIGSGFHLKEEVYLNVTK